LVRRQPPALRVAMLSPDRCVCAIPRIWEAERCSKRPVNTSESKQRGKQYPSQRTSRDPGSAQPRNPHGCARSERSQLSGDLGPSCVAEECDGTHNCARIVSTFNHENDEVYITAVRSIPTICDLRMPSANETLCGTCRRIAQSVFPISVS
jgi:hypothetical protein